MFGTVAAMSAWAIRNCWYQVDFIWVIIGQVNDLPPLVTSSGHPCVKLSMWIGSLGRMHHDRAVAIGLALEVADSHTSEKQPDGLKKRGGWRIELVVWRWNLIIRDVPDQIRLIEKELRAADVANTWSEDLGETWRKNIDDADEQRSLRRGRELEIGMMRQRSFKRKQSAVRGALLPLVHKSVHSCLVALVVNYQRRQILDVDLAKHIDQILKVWMMLHHGDENGSPLLNVAVGEFHCKSVSRIMTWLSSRSFGCEICRQGLLRGRFSKRRVSIKRSWSGKIAAQSFRR